MADPMRAQLHAGDTLHIRYAGAEPSSTQGRAWRTVRIIVGPHEDYNYTHGQDSRDGVTMGRVVGAFEGKLHIKDLVSQRLHTVLRKHCRKTSVTQMRRKEGRAKAWTRRRQGIGAVVS